MTKEHNNAPTETSQSLHTLSRKNRWLIQFATILFFLWMFLSGWINLFNRLSLDDPIIGRAAIEWGGTSVGSVVAAVLVGYIISWGIIWEVEILLQRRRSK